MKQKIVIWGASGHALVVADIIRLQGEYEIAGFLDNINPERQGEEFCGSTVLGGQEQLDILQTIGIRNLLFGFGDQNARLRLSELVRLRGFKLATAIHPRSIIAQDVSLRSGTVVAAGAVINSGAVVGENVIINTCASIDHECIVGDGVNIGPGVTIGGGVTLGKGAYVGIGAIIRDNVRIGDYSIIGAGAVVLSDLPEYVLAYGIPAKIKQKTNPDER